MNTIQVKDLNEAIELVHANNPSAIYHEEVPGYFIFSDYTYCTEYRCVIATFDDCFNEVDFNVGDCG